MKAQKIIAKAAKREAKPKRLRMGNGEDTKERKVKHAGRKKRTLSGFEEDLRKPQHLKRRDFSEDRPGKRGKK